MTIDRDKFKPGDTLGDLVNKVNYLLAQERSITGKGAPRGFFSSVFSLFRSPPTLSMESELFGILLTNNHPGRGLLVEVNVGTWNSTLHRWIYDTSETYKAIDWRCGVTEPNVGATGLGVWRSSDVYGEIVEIIDLDCEVCTYPYT